VNRTTAAHRPKHWSVRAFRALLALYPGEFRDEYGRELAMVFADRWRDATSVGERVQVWIDAVMGVLREAPKEHVQMLMQDLRYAIRTISHSPGFALTVVLTLALGIGANTAIFQLIDAVNLRTLPIQHPEELAEVRIIGGNQGFGVNPGRYTSLTRPVWLELRAHQEAFSGIFAWAMNDDVRVGEQPALRRAKMLWVSGDLFRTLGVQAFRGRLLEAADEGACPASNVVVSHSYWQRELGGRDLSEDLRITVNLERKSVVGVTPPEFFGLAVGEQFDLAMPMCQGKEPLRRELFDIAVMGRLRPGWTLERASEHLQALSPGIFDAVTPAGYSAGSTKTFKSFRMAAYPAASGVSALRQDYESSLRLLLAITGLVLMLACANLANLMLARMTSRDREVAVRLALGASRIRLVRQFLTESCVLAAIGAIAAVGVAQVLSRALIVALTTQAGGPILTLPIDWRILLFAALVAVVTCVIFGVAPAARASRVEPAEAMKSGGRGNTGGRARFATQRAMVVTQIAVSLVLLVAALLFVRSFRNLITFNPGMRQANISIAYVGFRQIGIEPERANEFARTLLEEIKSTPGIVSAGTTTNPPLLGSSWTHGIYVGATENWSKFTWVSPGYLETMGIPILQGRDFTLHDTTSSRRVAIVNEAFVKIFSPNANPIGQTLRTSPEPRYPATTYEIIGVIPNTRYDNLRGAQPQMVFAPDSQNPNIGSWATVMIHSTIDPSSAINAIKQRLSATHPGILMEFDVFQDRIRDGLLRERLLAMLAGFFGALAAVLAMVGLYGMIAFAVNQRRQEIGIRVALGARRVQVIGMVMKEAARLLIVGTALGTAAALLAGRSASTFLFGLTSYDPTTIAAAIALLAAIATAASFVPARAAARLDPLTALRQE
jgi:predicted permease